MTSVLESGKIAYKDETLFRMWESSITPGDREPIKHNHTVFEISLVLSGSAIYSTPTGEFTICAGDILVFSGNEFHSSPKVFEPGIKMLNLHFLPKFLSSHGSDSFSQKNANYYFVHNENFRNYIPAKDNEPLRKTVLAIKDELESKNQEYAQMIKILLTNFFILLFRNYGYSCDNAPSQHYSHISKALKFIDENFTEAITLNQIAEYVNLSPTYFSLLFRRFCNITVWDYIASKRIEKAEQMILSNENQKSMLEIALSCGYNNTANFNKSFKKQTGMTPSEFKKSDNLM